MKLIVKMIIAFILLLSLPLAFNYSLYSQLDQKTAVLEERINLHSTVDLKTLSDIRFYTAKMALGIDQAVMGLQSGSSYYQDEADEARRFQKLRQERLADLKKNVALFHSDHDDPTLIFVELLEAKIRECDALSEQLLQEIAVGDKDDAAMLSARIHNELKPINSQLFDVVNSFLIHLANEINEAEAVVKVIKENTLRTIAVIYFVVFVLTLITIFFLLHVTFKSAKVILYCFSQMERKWSKKRRPKHGKK